MRIIFLVCLVLTNVNIQAQYQDGRDYQNTYAHDCLNPPFPVNDIDYIYDTFLLPDIISRPNFRPESVYHKPFIDESSENWHVSYALADFDHSGSNNYFVAQYYTSAEALPLVICKKINGQWQLVWKESTKVLGAACVQLKDINNDGEEDIVVKSGSLKKIHLDIIQRTQSGFFWITEQNNFNANEKITLTDEDGDGVYEVLVGPEYDIYPFSIDPDTGEPKIDYHHGYQLYKLEDEEYHLINEWDSRGGSGQINSSLGIMHPGEIPISEILSVPEDGHSSGEALRFFIGGLGLAKLTEVNWSTVRVYDNIPVTFVKLWENKFENKDVKSTHGFM